MAVAASHDGPRPWFGIPHGRQWPYWIGALVGGIVVIVAVSIGFGLLILALTNYSGMFVMGRRIARRKERSTGWATFMVFLGGWITVLVYTMMEERWTPKERGVIEPFRVTRW